MACPRCRYDTRGLAAERCPECGATKTEASQLLYTRAQLAAPGLRVTALAISTGAGILCSVGVAMIAADAWQRGFYGSSDFLVSAANIAVCGGQISVGTINWHRFLARRPLINIAWTGALLFSLVWLSPAGW